MAFMIDKLKIYKLRSKILTFVDKCMSIQNKFRNYHINQNDRHTILMSLFKSEISRLQMHYFKQKKKKLEMQVRNTNMDVLH